MCVSRLWWWWRQRPPFQLYALIPQEELKKDTMKPIVTHARDRELTAACNSTTKRYFKIAFQSFV